MSLLSEFLDDIENDLEFKKLELLERQASKIKKLEELITQVSQLYGGDDPQFLREYISDIMVASDVEEALTCFRSLVHQSIAVNNRK